jgi:hypothetical protein
MSASPLLVEYEQIDPRLDIRKRKLRQLMYVPNTASVTQVSAQPSKQLAQNHRRRKHSQQAAAGLEQVYCLQNKRCLNWNQPVIPKPRGRTLKTQRHRVLLLRCERWVHDDAVKTLAASSPLKKV